MRKTIFALFIGLTLFTTFSCNKDKNDSPASVVGKWTFIDESIKIYDGTTSKSSTTVPFTSSTIEFKSDNTYTSTDDDGQVTTGTYSYDASAKTLSDEDGSYSVTQLTSSNMTLHLEDTEDDGTGTMYKYVIDAHLKK